MILLPFGNVTGACLILLSAYLVLWGVFILAVKGFRYVIALDDQHAPEVTIPNPFDSFYKHVLCKLASQCITRESFLNSKVVKRGDLWFVKRRGDNDSYAQFTTDGEYKDWWPSKGAYWTRCGISSKEKALEFCKEHYENISTPVEYNYINTLKVLGTVVGIDIVIELLKYNLLLTLIGLAVTTLVFSTRFIAKKLYKTMSNTDNNTKDIQEIKSSLDRTPTNKDEV